MLKMKRMAILAVVALGLVALAAPAGASANKRTNEDIKRLGSNVNELRKKTDEMNRTISSLASVAGDSLTKLQAGLVKLSDTTANFKYGVVQVAAPELGKGGIAGVGPSHFYATPPLYKTGEQSTVTFPIPGTVGQVRLWTAVRSVNPDDGSRVACRVVINQGAGYQWMTLRIGTSDGILVPIPQSRIKPENGSTAFPYSLVDTEDRVINITDTEYGGSASLATGAITRVVPSLGAALGNNTIAVATLSCLVV